MKHFTISRINTNADNMEYVADVLNQLPPQPIACANWEDQYPSKPKVEFSAVHSGNTLYLQYEVHENELLALVEEDNGRVWTDSCVEFFVSFDGGQHYYNFEFNCIGKALIGYRKVG